MSKQLLLFVLVAGFIFFLSFIPINRGEGTFHTEAERAYFASMPFSPPPVDTNLMFPAASACSGCHGYDPNQYAMVDGDGNDVNIFDDWEATLMANAAKDPFWRAKVSHEILEIPAFKEEIETKCTSCHAPMGHYTAILRGADHYSMEELLLDTIGLDGISCGACHMISEEDLGFTNSGLLHFDTNRVVFGPYEFPFAAPMQTFVGFEPIASPHILDAGICAGCHTLITDTYDLEGNPTGDRFVEQATYHEWLNSTYDVEDVTCQNCHMPVLDDSIVISANYLFLEGRFPYGQHELVGGNSFMLQLMKENKEALDIKASDANFDETIAKTLKMLQEKTLDLSLGLAEVYDDTAFFKLSLVNKAGHKFPSGYPSRRAVVEFLVENELGDTIFHSGKLTPDYYVAHEDLPFEPHYSYINREDQVQIYEIVPLNVNLDFTSVLEHGYIAGKDNRLPPTGFTTSHPSYDTVRIYGAAALDPDFNHQNGQEGSGSDELEFRIGLNDYIGNLQVQAFVHYQPLPPKWMESIFAASTPEIDSFRQMFDLADQTPVLIASASLTDVFVEGGMASSSEQLPMQAIRIFPNPNNVASFNLDLQQGLQIKEIQVWDAAGKMIERWSGHRSGFSIQGTGLFVVRIQTDRGVLIRRVIRQ